MLRVACAVILKDKKILVTQRGPGMTMPFKWEFPGGKIEVGETDEACILRELKEELHISVLLSEKLTETTHRYNDFQITLVPFLAHYESGSITLTEHMNYSWLSPDELNDPDWAEADKPVVTEVLNMFASNQLQFK